MRTTLDLDQDILQITKEIARERRQSVGRVVSGLVRQALQPQVSANHGEIPVLPRMAGAQPVTSAVVKELLEAED